MHRLWPLGLLLALTGDFGQTSSTDSQTLQALLMEVRQLRQDLRTTTVAAQRVQVLLYRLQGQEAAVARVQHRVAEARSTLTQTQFELKHDASTIKQTEDRLNDTLSTAERKRLEDLLTKLRPELESEKAAEQQWETREIEAEQDLRAEQAKLGALQDQLDRLDKALESSSTGPTK